MNKPRETPRTLVEMPLDEALQKARTIRDDGTYDSMPSVSRTLLKEVERLERTVAELIKYALHTPECELTVNANRRFPIQTGVVCTCGLDELLPRLDGSKP
jgi:hypothetical protein